MPHSRAWYKAHGLKRHKKRHKKKEPTEQELWVRLRRKATRENNKRFFAEEFDRLVRLSEIRDVFVWWDGFRVSFDAVNTLKKGERFYIGTYSFTVVLSAVKQENFREAFQLVCCRSGRHDGKKGVPYPNGQGLGGLCLGPRISSTADLLKKGEYFSLITSVIDSVSHINGRDSIKLAEYRKILSNGNLEIARQASKAETMEYDLPFQQ